MKVNTILYLLRNFRDVYAWFRPRAVIFLSPRIQKLIEEMVDDSTPLFKSSCQIIFFFVAKSDFFISSFHGPECVLQGQQEPSRAKQTWSLLRESSVKVSGKGIKQPFSPPPPQGVNVFLKYEYFVKKSKLYDSNYRTWIMVYKKIGLFQTNFFLFWFFCIDILG